MSALAEITTVTTATTAATMATATTAAAFAATMLAVAFATAVFAAALAAAIFTLGLAGVVAATLMTVATATAAMATLLAVATITTMAVFAVTVVRRSGSRSGLEAEKIFQPREETATAARGFAGRVGELGRFDDRRTRGQRTILGPLVAELGGHGHFLTGRAGGAVRARLALIALLTRFTRFTLVARLAGGTETIALPSLGRNDLLSLGWEDVQLATGFVGDRRSAFEDSSGGRD